MLTTQQAKARARVLKTFLKECDIELTHGVCLEAIARLEGHKKWANFLVVAQAKEALIRNEDDVITWPLFVFRFDETEADDYREKLFVLSAGSTVSERDYAGVHSTGKFEVPQGFKLDADIVVTAVHSNVPAIDKYGLPDFADEDKAPTWFREELGSACIETLGVTVRDTGDDSASVYWFEARVHPDKARALLGLMPAPPADGDKAIVEQAYAAAVARVFADDAGRPAMLIVDNLRYASQHGFFGMANGEGILQERLDGLITVNGPYDKLNAAALLFHVQALARTEYEKRMSATR